jgi:hypothetical protein
VLEAAIGGGWPQDASEDLQMHVQHCAQCAEVAQVVSALAAEREVVSGRARVPAAGQVWWRAVVRARLEAAQTAARPITWLQGVAAACSLSAVAAVGAIAWPSVTGVAARATGVMAGLDPGARQAAGSMLAMLTQSVPVMLVTIGIVLLAPILVLYFALSDRE